MKRRDAEKGLLLLFVFMGEGITFSSDKMF